MAPNTWRSGGFVVASINKERVELVIGEHAGLVETVASIYNLEVDPSIICIQDEIVFLDKLLWNVFKVDFDKFWSIHRCGQVKSADVKICKACIEAGEDAVDYEFNKFERAGWCANVLRVTDAVSSNDNPHLIRIFFMGPVFNTTLVYVILFWQLTGISSYRMIRKVSVPLTHCFWGL